MRKSGKRVWFKVSFALIPSGSGGANLRLLVGDGRMNDDVVALDPVDGGSDAFTH
jgi:hypothetical protein